MREKPSAGWSESLFHVADGFLFVEDGRGLGRGDWVRRSGRGLPDTWLFFAKNSGDAHSFSDGEDAVGRGQLDGLDGTRWPVDLCGSRVG